MPRKKPHAAQNREHRKMLEEVNEGNEGKQLRGIMQEFASESGVLPGRATAEVSETVDGFIILAVMDPRTGYYRAFFIGDNRPLAERVSFAIRSGMGMQLPDGYVVEPAEGQGEDAEIRRE